LGHLDRALDEISSIRRQMAQSSQFYGYGPLAMVCTGALAAVAALVQGSLLPDPAHHAAAFLGLWVSVAVLSAALTAVHTYTRSQRLHSGLSDQMIRMAAEQFIPALIAGLLLTIVLLRYTPGAFWMLPGLWQILFSLGVFASCRLLPRAMFLAGAWYLLTGLFCLALGDGRALLPWCMGLPFAVGQTLVAVILFLSSQPEKRYGL
jgi:hypothetical protein